MFCTDIKKINLLNYLKRKENPLIFTTSHGEMAEWSNAAVLKTVEGHTSGGSNPSFSASKNPQQPLWVFCKIVYFYAIVFCENFIIYIPFTVKINISLLVFLNLSHLL